MAKKKVSASTVRKKMAKNGRRKTRAGRTSPAKKPAGATSGDRVTRQASRPGRPKDEAKPKKTTEKAAQATAQATTAPPPDDQRGEGGEEYPLTSQDYRVARLAIVKRWPTREDVKKALLNRVAQEGLSTQDTSLLLKATRLYMLAEGQNQADEHKQLADKLEVYQSDKPPLSADGQRAAIARAIVAERKKRSKRRRSRRSRDVAGGGEPEKPGAGSDG